MKKVIGIPVLLLIMGVGLAPAKTKIAVMNLRIQSGVSVVMGPLINELFCAKLPELDDYEVISGPTIDTLLSKSGDPLLMECNATDCYYLIGSGLEAEQLLAGALSKQGEAYIVQLMLLDIARERILNSISVKYEGLEVYLVDKLESYLQMVLGIKDVPPEEKVVSGEDLIKKEPPPAEEPPEEKEPKLEEGPEQKEKEPEKVVEKEKFAEEKGFVDRRKVTNIEQLSLMDRKIARSKERPEKQEPLFVNKEEEEEDYSIDEYETFRWSETNVNYFLIGAGGSAVMVEDYMGTLFDIFSYDVRIGYQIKRSLFMAEFRKMDLSSTTIKDVIYKIRTVESRNLLGGGIKYGFEMFQMFEKWLTFTPCLCAGLYTYDLERITDEQYVSGGDWSPPISKTVTKKSYFGVSGRFDIGKRWYEYFGGYLTIEPQLMYVPDVIIIINVGLKGVI